MKNFCVLPSLFLGILFAASAAATALQPAVQSRSAPGKPLGATYNAINRNLAAASLEKREEYKAELSLARSWNDASLIELEVERSHAANDSNLEASASIQVLCKHCYVLGTATASLAIDPTFNLTQAVNQTLEDTREEFDNFTSYIGDYLDGYFSNITDEISDPDFSLSDLDLPPFDHDFNLSLPEIPQSTLKFQFDQVELYMELETVITAGATYELNLFTSKSPYGIKVKDLQLGFVLTLDLILSVDGEVDITSGFHIKLDDGVSMTLPLFGNAVSDVNFSGGSFEFLPVTLQSADVVLAAALRVGVSCGIGGLRALRDVPLVDIETGVEAALYANVAEFITNITHVADDEECALHVVQEYNFALGAIAGASVEVAVPKVGNLTAAAVAEGSTAIYTTTLADVCAVSKTASAGAAGVTSGVVARREDATRTTVSTEVTYSGVSCKVAGIANCPVTARVSTRTVVTKSYVTTVPSGSTVEFSALTLDSVETTVPFGEGARSIREATSGPPVQYTDASAGEGDRAHDTIGGVSKKLIIGVSVGVGVPIVLLLVGGLLYFHRRRRTYAVSVTAPDMVAGPHVGRADDEFRPKEAAVNVHEVQK